MQDTWTTRDLPVLDATISLLEASFMVTVSDIAGRTGIGERDVAAALEALDPVYLDFRKTTTGGDPTYWYVHKATPEARRAVGQWPTPASLVTRLAEEFSSAAADERDAERKGLLTYAARLVSDTLRDVAERAAAAVLSPPEGLVPLPEQSGGSGGVVPPAQPSQPADGDTDAA